MRGKRYLVVVESFNTVLAKDVSTKLEPYITPDMLMRPPRKHRSAGVPDLYPFANGAELHMQSFEQDPASFEGPEWDAVLFNEPSPQKIFNAVRRGIVARSGTIYIAATLLTEPWMIDQFWGPLQDPDDPLHATCDLFTGSIHENCIQCSGGYMEHDYIEAWLATLSPEERAAREHGIPISLSNRPFGYVQDQTHVVPDLW